MTRQTTKSELNRILGTKTDVDLANRLTDLRLISDEAVHLSDVPDCDLVAALVAVRKTL